MTANRQILLAETPKGKLGPEHFRMQEGAMPSPKDGEVLLKVRLISLDAANRAWMQGATYREAVGAGSVMAGGAIAEVIESKDAKFAKGDLVFADTGWQEYAALPGCKLLKVPSIKPMTNLLSVYGKEKCDWLKSELGFDEAVDYKSGPVFKALKAACPDGIDVYFDNVGGDIFEACLSQMKLHGRIACCGAVSAYDGAAPASGPRGVPGLIVVKRLRVQGFIVMDYYDQAMKAVAELQGWVASGKLKVKEDILSGLENTPQALVGLLAGENVGKRMVKVS